MTNPELDKVLAHVGSHMNNERTSRIDVDIRRYNGSSPRIVQSRYSLQKQEKLLGEERYETALDTWTQKSLGRLTLEEAKTVGKLILAATEMLEKINAGPPNVWSHLKEENI